jgi:Kdo2-lipid IVA lauroyltransferase/acyltransferase
MIAFFYYPLFWILYAISLLPFWALYRISAIIRFLLFNIFRYRTSEIKENINIAFPEKAEAEKTNIRRTFQKHFCDIFVESLKLLSISEKNIMRRFVFEKESEILLEGFFGQGKMVLIVLGHYGNWEYMGPGFKFWRSKPLISAYRPLRGKIADRILRKTRERFGTVMIPMNSLTREMFRLKNEVCAVLLLADQSPSLNRQAYWIKFFNQETPVFQGTEKLARKFNTPVIFVSIRKEKRGFYKAYFKLVSDTPNSLKEGELTYLHTKILEEDIKREPGHWLWSHKRWKHREKRGDNPLLSF